MNVILYATAWGPQHGGVNAFNRRLAIALAERLGGAGRVHCVTEHCDSSAGAEAHGAGVRLVEVSLPADLDAIPRQTLGAIATAIGRFEKSESVLHLGHDVISGRLALAMSDVLGGQSMLVHHMNYGAYHGAKAGPASETQAKVELQRNLFSRADRLAAVGPLLARSLRDISGRDDIVELTPGIDLLENRSSDATLRMITYGRFDLGNAVIKQALLVAASYGRAVGVTAAADAQLRVIGLDAGDTALEKDLKAMSDREAGRLTNILPLPFQANPAAMQLELVRCNLACVVSYHEGFGLAAWEAIGAGVPLIVTQNSGVFQLVAERLGGAGTGCLRAVDIAGSRDPRHFASTDVKNVSGAIMEILADIPAAKRDAARLRDQLQHHGPSTWLEAADAVLGLSACSAEVNQSSETSPVRSQELSVTATADNPIAECAELTIGSTQGSNAENFDVLPEARFGWLEMITTQGRVSVAVRRATLRLATRGCEINAGERLGDDAGQSPHLAARPGNTWEIRGPLEDGVLSRRVLGNQRLCSVALTRRRATIGLSLSCRTRDLRFEYERPVMARLSGTQTRIIELFLARCVSDSEGDPVLGTAELKIEKSSG